MERERLFNILTSDNIVESINQNLDNILILIPEIKDMIGFNHNHPHHHLDVWNHTLLALSMSPNDFEIRLVLLLHDIGKPHSYQDEEIRHFRGHALKSAEMTFKILERLNFNEDEILELCYLIKEHDTLITEEEIENNRELMIKRFQIQCCDALAHNPTKLEKRKGYLLNINNKLNKNKEREKYKKLIENK